MNSNQEILTSHTQLRVAELNDQNIASVSLLVARFMPFYTYSFGLMLEKIIDQLRHQTNICVLKNNRIVAYAGWIEVDEQDVQRWYREGGDLPSPNWSNGNPLILTILVAQEGKLLKDIRRGLVERCHGRRIYAERVGRTKTGGPVRRTKIIKRASEAI